MLSNQFSRLENFMYKLGKEIPPFPRNFLIEKYNSFRSNQLKKLKTPKTLVFYATDYCNSKCSHCFYWKNLNKKQDELSLEQIHKIIKSLKYPLDLLTITGGEPFLREDIYEICSSFYKLNKTKRINIATNGLLAGKIVETVEKILKENKRLSIFVSLDGLKETHEKIRGVPGIWDIDIFLLKELKRIEQKNPSLSIFANITITKSNIHEIRELARYVKDELGINFKINILRTSRDYFLVPKDLLMDYEPRITNQPTTDELEDVYNWYKNETKSLQEKVELMKLRHSIDIIKFRKATLKCLAGLNDGVIFPNGNVSICEPTKPFANLKNYDFNFYNLWNSKEANLTRVQLSKCFCLQSCNLLNAMKYDSNTLKNLFN